MSGKTVGQQVQENNDKRQQLDDDVREYSKAMAPDWLKLIDEAITLALNHDIYRNRDFYLELVKKNNHLLGMPDFKVNVFRACPTPRYRQDIFKYHYQSGALEFLWCIPGAMRYWNIVHNAKEYLMNKETKRLAQFVLSMQSGELEKWVDKENGNKPNATLSIKKTEN